MDLLRGDPMLPTHHCLLDEATSHAAAGSWAQIERVEGNHTLAGWFGICLLTLLLLVPVLGGSVAFGTMLGEAAADYFLR